MLESKHRQFIDILYETSKVRKIEMSQLSTAVAARQPDITPLSLVQAALISEAKFIYIRGIYMPVHVALHRDIIHAASKEVKASCPILPITRIHQGPSTPDELSEWCNNLARSVGVYQPDPHRPQFYHCTPASFTRTK